MGGLNGRITSSIVNIIVTVPAQLFMRNTSCNPANLDIFNFASTQYIERSFIYLVWTLLVIDGDEIPTLWVWQGVVYVDRLNPMNIYSVIVPWGVHPSPQVQSLLRKYKIKVFFKCFLFIKKFLLVVCVVHLFLPFCVGLSEVTICEWQRMHVFDRIYTLTMTSLISINRSCFVWVIMMGM